jgi:hypothetical protein
LIDNAYVLSNFGTSGWTMLQVGNAAAAHLATVRQPGGKNIAIVWAGVNDAHAGFDAATIYARTVTTCAAARQAGYQVVLCTEIDDQHALANAAGWHDTIWPALNTLIRGDATIYDRLADLGADARLQDATDTTYFNADKLHLIAAGQTVVAGLVATEVNAL